MPSANRRSRQMSLRRQPLSHRHGRLRNNVFTAHDESQDTLDLLMRTLLLLLATAALGDAQQPFLTDDADVAPVRHFHLELLTEHDLLQRSAYPTLRQNTTRIQLTYGLLGNL